MEFIFLIDIFFPSKPGTPLQKKTKDVGPGDSRNKNDRSNAKLAPGGSNAKDSISENRHPIPDLALVERKAGGKKNDGMFLIV